MVIYAPFSNVSNNQEKESQAVPEDSSTPSLEPAINIMDQMFRSQPYMVSLLGGHAPCLSGAPERRWSKASTDSDRVAPRRPSLAIPNSFKVVREPRILPPQHSRFVHVLSKKTNNLFHAMRQKLQHCTLVFTAIFLWNDSYFSFHCQNSSLNGAQLRDDPMGRYSPSTIGKSQ